jgi:phosphate transport system substrate-binding protein
VTRATYAIAAGLALGLLSASAEAADITGAGATFPYPVYSKWAETYKKETGNGVNYQSIGSGGGIRQIQAKTVDFGATDAPLKGKLWTNKGWFSSRPSSAASCRSSTFRGLSPAS